MRNKLDSRTVGSALLATQEELKAAFNREQACEEGYNALLADLDSCRASQESSGGPFHCSTGGVASEGLPQVSGCATLLQEGRSLHLRVCSYVHETATPCFCPACALPTEAFYKAYPCPSRQSLLISACMKC